MARWGPDARGRLANAAMELFARRGYDETTVAEIAERAGLTERTFFRHFKDKREVLFAGSAGLEHLIVSRVADAPAGTSPMEAVVSALEAAGAVFNDDRRLFSRQRQAVINANAELQERELIKLASLTAAIAATLRQRGVREPTASLTAQAGMGVFRVAFERWVERAGERRSWATLVRAAFKDLRELVTTTG
jgi:AcrR family transcriptional regulator